MGNVSLCASPEVVLLLPSHSDLRELRATFIVNCVFNNFLTYTAILLNIVTMYAMQKTTSLPKTLKTLLFSIAISDVGIGLLAQPIYSSLLVKWLQLNHPSCNNYGVFFISANLFLASSFLSVVAVSVDRFLAIHLHLRYPELVTHKRIVIVVISIWVLSASVSFTMFWELQAYINLFILAFGFIISFVAYIKMYLTVRRHKNQIQSLLVVDETQSGIMTNYAAVVKTTVGVLYVYLVLLASYLPFFICMAVVRICRDSSIAKKQLYLFSLTLMFLNSSLNPVIYCWKMRHIRHAIIDILRNMPRMRNYSSRVNYDRSLSVVRFGNWLKPLCG